MPADSIDIEHLGRLIRLHLDDETASDMRVRIAEIIGMVQQIQAQETEGVEPLAHPLNLLQPLRGDEVTETNLRTELMANAPQAEDGFFLVPPVIPS